MRAGTVSKILGAGFRLGWLCAPKEMIPAFQGFLFGGGVNPFASRVATYFLRDNLAPHVALLVNVYRAKRDAMLRGLWEVLKDTDVEISKPEGGFFIWIKLPTGTDTASCSTPRSRPACSTPRGRRFFPNGGGERFIRLAFSFESPERCYEGARLIAQAIRRRQELSMARHRILVVDDEDNLRDVLMEVLKRDGHEVDSAVDGAEGLGGPRSTATTSSSRICACRTSRGPTSTARSASATPTTRPASSS